MWIVDFYFFTGASFIPILNYFSAQTFPDSSGGSPFKLAPMYVL